MLKKKTHNWTVCRAQRGQHVSCYYRHSQKSESERITQSNRLSKYNSIMCILDGLSAFFFTKQLNVDEEFLKLKFSKWSLNIPVSLCVKSTREKRVSLSELIPSVSPSVCVCLKMPSFHKKGKTAELFLQGKAKSEM